MRSVLAYTTARILVFVATLGVLYLFGARDLLLLGLAVLVSGLISLVLLSRQRDAVSSVVATTVTSGRRRLEQAKTAEDPEAAPASVPRPQSSSGTASTSGGEPAGGSAQPPI